VFLQWLEVKSFHAVNINPDFGGGGWPNGIDLCPYPMPQALTGSATEGEQPSPMALAR